MSHPFERELDRERVIYIIRNPSMDLAIQAARCVWETGEKFVEITLNSDRAAECIRRLFRELPEGALLGAGTVLDPDEVEQAAVAGASFIVTPVVNRELVESIRRRELFGIVGAMTPTEIYRAWKWGADRVKVFPAGSPENLRRLMGPLDRIPLVAVGGVHPGNIRDFWTAGASAALGGSFFRFDSRGAFDAKRLEEDILKIRELRRMHAGDAPACSGQAEA